MTITASTVLDRVSGALLDTAQRTWSQAEKVGYLNEALAATAAAHNDFYTVTTPFTVAPGEEQALPVDGVGLIDIPRNTGGRVVTQVDKSLLAESSRFWPATTRVRGVEHFTFDPRTPRRFVIFPPNNGAGIVDLIYAAVPPTIDDPTDVIPVNASYEPALVQYVLACCWSKNSKRQDLTKTNAAMSTWGSLLGLDTKTITMMTPKVAAQPGTTS